MNQKELCEEYGLKDLRGADLTGANIKLGNIIVQIKGVKEFRIYA